VLEFQRYIAWLIHEFSYSKVDWRVFCGGAALAESHDLCRSIFLPFLRDVNKIISHYLSCNYRRKQNYDVGKK
jgi:hypothetical protein